MQKSRRYSGACGSEYRAQGTGLRAQDSGHRAQGTGLRAQGSGHGAQGTGLTTMETVFRFLNLTGRNGEIETRGNSRTSVSFLNVVINSEVEMLYLYFGNGFQDVTRREGELETRGNSRVSSSSLNLVTLSGSDGFRDEVLNLYFGYEFRNVTMRAGEVDTRENSRVSSSSLNVVTLSGSVGCQNEVCYSKVEGSGNDPAFAGQIGIKSRNLNHFQVWGSDRSSISTLNFELFTLSLSSIRMHGKTYSNERIPIKRVFTN